MLRHIISIIQHSVYSNVQVLNEIISTTDDLQ